MKGTWMLLVLAILLLFGPKGPVMAEGRRLTIEDPVGAESGMDDRFLLAALPGAALAAGILCGKRRSDEA